MSKRLRSSEVCADCSGPGESHRPGPLPSSLLKGPLPRGRPLGSGGSRRPNSTPGVARRRNLGGLGAGPVPGLSEPGGLGGRRPPAPPSPPVPSSPLCPRPGGEAAGSRLLPQQEGAWAIHRKANYRSKMRAFSRLRPPEAAGVPPAPGATPPPDPLPARGPCLGWVHSPLPSTDTLQGIPVDDFPAPKIPASTPPPPGRTSRRSGSCKHKKRLRGSVCLSFGI